MGGNRSHTALVPTRAVRGVSGGVIQPGKVEPGSEVQDAKAGSSSPQLELQKLQCLGG